jgi:hypothetical protein
MELSSSTLYLVRIAQTAREYFRRNTRDGVEGTTLVAQALPETPRAGKDHRKIVTAIAPELLGSIWAIGTRAEAIVR